MPSDSPMPPLSVLWAKLPRGKDAPLAYHPLICHLLDVAAVAERMWDEVLSPAAHRHIAAGLGISDVAAARRWVALLAGLHDLGKSCPAFQFRDAADQFWQLYHDVRAVMPSPRIISPRDAPHGAVTGVTLGGVLAEHYGVSVKTARRLAQVVGGHHGFFPSADERKKLREGDGFAATVGNGLWREARARCVGIIGDAFGVLPGDVPQRIDDPTIMALAQITTVADWIGSNTDFFRFYADVPTPQPPVVDAENYLGRAREQAKNALNGLHWTGWTPPTEPRPFSALFPAIAEPRDLQRRIEEIANRLADDLPALLVVEAPMGEGKTEAALYAADRWGVNPGPRGCYVAMPTQATSNQMFSRVKAFLAARYPGKTVMLQLLHGHASLSAELQAMMRGWDPDRFIPAQNWDDSVPETASRDGASAEVIAGEWFAGGKRGLLPPFGVGTIDQALLAVLPTKHQFVRLGALAGKVVIFDEVHAYDAYMSTILECLLSWLGALGSPVVLLSATLPIARRDALLKAYGRGLQLPLPAELPQAAYPRISWLSRAETGAVSIDTSEQIRRTFALRWVDGALPTNGGPFILGERLRAALTDGGCAAVICNTVARARSVYEALKQYFSDLADDGQPELELFHARFRFKERDEHEKKALLRFGKPNGTVTVAAGGEDVELPVHRPKRAVLVATQVIEQSLDLDFDLMVSQMAPADLLLQRSGRLHRHARDNRPPRVRAPELWVYAPEIVRDGVPSFDGGTTFIYAEHVLLRSWLDIRNRETIDVPEQVEEIIEAVYDDQPCPLEDAPTMQAAWEKTLATLNKATGKQVFAANQSRLDEPFDPGDLLDKWNRDLAEDAPDLNPALQARTRLAEPSVMVVVLSPAEWEEYRRQRKGGGGRPSVEQLRFLLERSLSMPLWQLRWRQDLLDAAPGASRSAALHGCKLVVLDADGYYAPPGADFRIRLDEEIGVVVEPVARGER